MTTTPCQKLWVLLKSNDSAVVNNAVKVPTKDCDDVDDFIEAVKKKLSPKLDQVAVDNITLHLTEDSPALEPDDPLPASNTKQTALVVAFPPPSAAGSTSFLPAEDDLPRKRQRTEIEIMSTKPNMFTAFATDWGLDEQQMQDAQALAQKDGIDVSQPPSNLLLFLYAKGIFTDEDEDYPGERKRKFNALVSGKSAKSAAALKRLKTIVEVGESYPTRTALTQKSFFSAFVESHPEWAAGTDVFVAHRDHPNLQGKEHALVERFQKSGLCYMHAPVVLQHYLVAMSNPDQTPMLNIAEFLKKKMSGPALYQHIWEGNGGDSLDFLEGILATRPDPADVFHDQNFINVDLTRLLKSYGPGLISGFAVTKDFNSNEWRHVGMYRNIDFIGRHAMVLIGSRQVEGKTYYLMQNWWTTKPYVEVDSEYLLSSEATIHFIKEKQLKMGDFPTSFESLVECENGLDACEKFLPES